MDSRPRLWLQRFEDLQAHLASSLFIWSGIAGAGFPMFRIEHAITMIIAAAVAHLHVLWKMQTINSLPQFNINYPRCTYHHIFR
jgi:hypothetical protein